MFHPLRRGSDDAGGFVTRPGSGWRERPGGQGGISLGQAVRIEPAGHLDHLIQPWPPVTVPQGAEDLQDAGGLLGGLRRGDERHPVRAGA